MRRNCPLEDGYVSPSYNIQEAKKMGQVERTVPRVYAALEDCQEYHQSTMVEVAIKITE